MAPLRTLAGLLVFAFGVAAILIPSIAGVLPLDPSAIQVAGALTVLVGLNIAWAARRDDRSFPTPPVPETGADLPAAGADLDDEFDRLASAPKRGSEEWMALREELETRLHRLAVRVLVDRYSMTENEAGTVLAAGAWSDDPYAAAYFSDDPVAPESVRSRLHSLSPFGETRVGKRARRAVSELEAIASDSRQHSLTREEMLARAGLDPGRSSVGADDGVVPDENTLEERP
jgi:hypothetical protein